MKIEHALLGPVHIAWADAASVDTDLDAAMQRLGDDQHRRYRQLDAPRARRFATGRMLLTALVPAPHDGAVSISSACDQCGGDHGRPSVDGSPYAVNLSYAGDTVIAAAVVRAAASAVGIDIERSADATEAPMNDLSRLFSPLPPPTLRAWTEIEAVVKADGRGLRIPPADVAFGGASAVLLPGSRIVTVRGIQDTFEVASAPGPPQHVVSVAVVAPRAHASP